MPWSLRLALLATLISTASASCPDSTWTQYRDTCYWRSDSAATWPEANDTCHVLHPGAELVSIHDIEQDAFIAANVAVDDEGNRQYFYIGLYRDNQLSPWRWSDGSQTNFTMWFINDPDYITTYNCAIINYVEWGTWEPYSCLYDTMEFLCQVASS